MINEDDELRNPNFLKSLSYTITLWQVEQATRFLTQQEKELLFKEVMGKPKLEVVE